MTRKPLPAGKLPPELLASLLASIPGPTSDVVIGARPGVDAAVIELGDRYLVLALDPVTLSGTPGRFAVEINANDVAVMGGEPRWLLAAVLLPIGSDADEARRVMGELIDVCGRLHIDLIGGHTEITPGVTQPVVAACLVGEVRPDRLVTSAGAKSGDALLLAGSLAIEGTAILAREHAPALRTHGVREQVIRDGAALLDRPGISVLPAVRALTAAAVPHAMHDPTEGGLLAAARELAEASGVGLRLEVDRIPILPACAAVCEALQLDPLRLLASGSLLAAVTPEAAGAALAALRDAGLDGASVGTVLPPGAGTMIVRAGVEEPLPAVERDELARWEESQGG